MADGADANWRACTLCGQASLLSSHDEALACWRGALSAAQSFTPVDPRRAASLNNVGVGLLRTLQFSEAFKFLSEAENSWLAVASHVQDMPIPFASGSSSFHLRVGSDNAEPLIAGRRRRYAEIASAGLAIARTNAFFAQLDAQRRLDDDGLLEWRDALVRSLGRQAPEVLLIDAARVDVPLSRIGEIYRLKHAELDAFRPSLTGAFSAECENLEMATAFSALFVPQLVAAPAALQDEHMKHDMGGR